MNCAVIVETRPIPLRGIILQHMQYLKGWELFLFTTTSSKSFFENELKDIDGKICTFNGDKFSEKLYNELLTTVDFWQVFQAYKRVLIFQHDSGILREGIDEFTEWDYIGAPIKHIPYPAMNGGLSLRNPKLMLDICKKYRWNTMLGNEDMFFCNIMHRGFGSLAPKVVASDFSCETIFALGTFGYHAIDRWLTKDQVELILNQKTPIFAK